MDLFTKMDIKAVQNGLVAKVGGARNFTVLASIASFAGKTGEAYPSQELLAEITGYSRKTIVKPVGELRNVTIEGEPIIRILQEKTPNGKRNKYKLSPKSGFWFGGVVTEKTKDVTSGASDNVTEVHMKEELISNKNHKQEKDKELVFDNAKDVLNYYQQKYFEQYDVAYQPNYGRDMALIKNKIQKNFTDEQIIHIVDVVTSEYDKRWANDKFPRPTIGQLATWLGNEALTIASQRADEEERIETDNEKYSMDDEYFDKLMNEF